MTTSRGLKLERIDDYRWQLPVSARPGMRVPGLVFADKGLMGRAGSDQALEQVANVACLPGVVGASMAMPDVHWGYGFPVGGVAATSVEDGVVSPGGVGFDINCGVRLLRSSLDEREVRPRIRELIDALFAHVPVGVGASGGLRIRPKEMERVLVQGARWAVAQGYGDPQDLEMTEDEGRMDGLDRGAVGPRPRQRGANQLGTLGAGNHFLEIQVVDQVYDNAAAGAMGLAVGQVTVLIHCGSRGLGHQVCDDFLKEMGPAARRYQIELPDRQLASVPVRSPEGQAYLSAMGCAANFAWANRQVIAHQVREAFQDVFDIGWRQLGLEQVYDVTHNIAKLETQQVDGVPMRVCVHRKGATRAFPPEHPELPARYRAVGQPVLVPGDMGRYSYVAVGGPLAMERSFGSTCHGAGRLRSRGEARRLMRGRDVQQELLDQGVVVQAKGWGLLAEEAPLAYKDVAEVMEVAHQAGLSTKVARMRPLGVVKG